MITIYEWFVHSMQTNMFMSGAVSTVILTMVGRYGILFFTKMGIIIYRRFTLTIRVVDSQSKFNQVTNWINANSKSQYALELKDNWDREYINIGRFIPMNGISLTWYRRLPVIVIKGEKEIVSQNYSDYAGWVNLIFLFRSSTDEIKGILDFKMDSADKEIRV